MTLRFTRGLLGIFGASMLAGCGITGNLRLNPGYADFGSPHIGDSGPDLALSLGPLPLMLARRISQDDPETIAMLRDLKAIRVLTYQTDGDFADFRNRADSMAARLTAFGWAPVLVVREEDGFVSALLRIDGDHIRGLAVIVQDQGELTLINLIGKIHPELLGDYLTELEVDHPSVSIAANVGQIEQGGVGLDHPLE